MLQEDFIQPPFPWKDTSEQLNLLTENMGFSKTKSEGTRFRFEIKNKEKIIDDFYSNKQKREHNLLNHPSTVVDLVCLPYTQRGSMGVGTVHHIAW